MHQHVAHPPGQEPAPGVLDNISDTLLNAFAKLRKPDERFLQMREGVDKSEEGLQNSERIWSRLRARTNGEYLALTRLRVYGSRGVLRLKRRQL
jgi:sorting nexin-4